MKRYIITGAPGAGKTAIVRQLELDGFSVVEEAATDVFAAAHAYENRVFFIRNLGFVTPTAARRISFEDTLRFEKIHQQTYQDFGVELVPIDPGGLVARVSVIRAAADL